RSGVGGDRSCGGSLGGGIDGRAGQQTLVDLAQRDREGLLLDLGLEERSDVLEQAFAELGVVSVDLAGALGRVEHELVLRVGLLQKIVDRRVGDAFGNGARRGHEKASQRFWGVNVQSKSTNSRAACSTSVLTMTTSNSATAA